MSERKKNRHRGKGVKDDNVSLLPEDVSRSSSENFHQLFVALCEEYDVTTVPKILSVVDSLGETTSVMTKRRIDRRETLSEFPHSRNVSEDNGKSTPPLIYVMYERPKEFGNPQKIECRGHELSVCILDALSLSIDKFSTVTTIRLRNCSINAYGISQIAQMITDIGCVRDLNLDMNPNIRENYYLLLSPAGRLRYLSLKYCNISDRGLEKIANELKYTKGEMSELIALDVANNRITDLGAVHIAGMLHTNRSLQSIVLAGNGITDEGAAAIIQELCMYPLSHDEIVNLRRLNIHRLMAKPMEKSCDSIHRGSRISTNSGRHSKKNSRSQKTRKTLNKNDSINVLKEDSSVDETLIDAGLHPFVTENRRIKGQIMVIGNFELQHLNISYNHLTNETLKEIAKCLFYQSYEMFGDLTKGLIHVNLEGNNFETEGNESLDQLRKLLRERASSREEQMKKRPMEAPVQLRSNF